MTINGLVLHIVEDNKAKTELGSHAVGDLKNWGVEKKNVPTPVNADDRPIATICSWSWA